VPPEPERAPEPEPAPAIAPRAARRLPARLGAVRRVPAPLAILLAVATVQFLAWMLVLPALQAPDEAEHFAYVQRLVETGQRPPRDGDGRPRSPELDTARIDAGLTPLEGNLSARPYWTELDERVWHARDAALGPHARDARTGPISTARNPPGYYAYEGIAYAAASGGSFFDRLYAMRLANLPLYLLTIVMTWVLAGMLLGEARWPRTVATGVVALHPQLVAICAGVSPDSMLTAIWSVFLVVAVRTLRRGLTWPAAAGLAALAVASVVTHPRGAPLAIVALLVVALALRRRIAGRVPGWAVALAATAALALVLVALVAGAGVLRGTGEGGFSVREFASYVWQFYLPKLPFMAPALGPGFGARTAYVDTFYGAFASLEVRWPAFVYDVLAAATVAGLVAVAAVAVRARDRLRAHLDVAVLLVAAPLTLIAALHFAAYRSLRIDPTDPVIVGRYLLPLIALFGVAIAAVVRALPARLAVATGTTVLFGAALLGVAGLGETAVRFYA
jgi:hypothetical protein